MRTPILKHVKKFNELFLAWTADHKKSVGTEFKANDANGKYSIGPYCRIDSKYQNDLPAHLGVTASSEVISTIRGNMLEGYDVYFNIIVFQDEAHVYAQYHHLCGSRLLAIIDPTTIPCAI